MTDHWFFTSSATVSVIVNNPPEVAGASVSGNEDEQLQITLNGSDLDNDSLIYNLVQQPQNGTLSGSAPDLTYTPNANYSGADSFTFNAQDDYFVSETVEITISLSAVNDAPIVNDGVFSTTENQSLESEMRTCDGCCGDTFEVGINEPCPMVSCAPCNEASDETASSSVDSIIRNSLIAIVFVAVLVFIQMSRRSEGNH